ncbi:MAG: hypothetical protein ACOYJ2_06550 [Rickettsiales bacterium]
MKGKIMGAAHQISENDPIERQFFSAVKELAQLKRPTFEHALEESLGIIETYIKEGSSLDKILAALKKSNPSRGAISVNANFFDIIESALNFELRIHRSAQPDQELPHYISVLTQAIDDFNHISSGVGPRGS